MPCLCINIPIRLRVALLLAPAFPPLLPRRGPAKQPPSRLSASRSRWSPNSAWRDTRGYGPSPWLWWLPPIVTRRTQQRAPGVFISLGGSTTRRRPPPSLCVPGPRAGTSLALRRLTARTCSTALFPHPTAPLCHEAADARKRGKDDRQRRPDCPARSEPDS